MDYRIGIGYDIHRLVEGRKLLLGGIEVPYVHGLLGHSDADVLLHAICDALLGAMGKADIGELFPDSDPRYSGIASTELLRIVAGLLAQEKYEIVNIDSVIIAQEPKLTPFKKQIQENIAAILGLRSERVGVKAKTNEGLDEIGAKKAIACYVVAFLSKEESP